jgi:tetratricopeptide (TPR) repeat protein
MADRTWANVYGLSDEQLAQLDEAESLMEAMDLSAAENVLLGMLSTDPECVPVLTNLGHLYGKYLSEFESAVEYYEKVLEIEPDNAWARDARRRYARYVGRD